MTTQNPVIQKKVVEFALSDKQLLAYDYLTLHQHDSITELVFGGGARGGKTYLGSFWIIGACMSMPGSQWLIAREELKSLKRTTMRTFFKVLSVLGLKNGLHYKYNAQDMILSFVNGSVVFFGELKKIPSDPEFDRIGSYDLTGAWVDEAQEVCKDAKDALQFRFTVLKSDGWEVSPKTLYTCNPSKNWIYSDFWKPILKEGIKVNGKHFITSLYSDNPYIDHKKYKDNVLKTKNKIKIERLLHGNFEYDDDPSKIFDYDKILDMWTNLANMEEFENPNGAIELRPIAKVSKYMSVDPAGLGKDKTVIVIWEGLKIVKIIIIDKNRQDDLQTKIEELSKKHVIPRSNIIVDADGMGIGIVHNVSGVKGFLNGSSAIQSKKAKTDDGFKMNYANLKTQCYFKFADYCNDNLIQIVPNDPKIKETLTEELEQVKQVDFDKDEKKIRITSKDKIKELLGRSPDISDAIMMRFYFVVKPKVIFRAVTL